MCAFGDYLSELCALLEYEGFKVNTDRLEWRQISVCINTDFIGRIMNNIISNIEKYGKHENEVCIQLCYGNEEVGISIQNSITRLILSIKNRDWVAEYFYYDGADGWANGS